MYSWKKFKVKNSGSSYPWKDVAIRDMSVDTLLKDEDVSKIIPHYRDYHASGDNFVTDDSYSEGRFYNQRDMGYVYEYAGTWRDVDATYGDVYFKFVGNSGSRPLLTKCVDYINRSGVKIGLEIINSNTTDVHVDFSSNSDLNNYINYTFDSNTDTSIATSSYSTTYPNAGVKNGYLYLKIDEPNTPPILNGNIRLSKRKLNGYSDSVYVSWSGAADTDGNLEGYRLYVTKKSYYSSGYPELIYTGSSTSYTYRVSGVTSPYDLHFSVEAFDSEGEKSDRIQSSTVSVFVPKAPRISGNDADLGTKNNLFDISYIVEDDDADDSVSVTIKVDENVVKTENAISTGFKKTFNVDTKPLSFAKHTVTIIAKDKYGGTDTRIYTFTKSNKAPTISGYDTNLGEKRSAFSVKYTIHDDDNDSVTVVEKLNGSIRRTLSNVQKDTEISINISESDIKSLKVGEKNTIEIVASDSRGATAFRRYYFTRNNLAPTISGNDKDMGVINDKFEYVFSISDVEKDTIYYSTYLDNKLLSKQVEAVDGKKYATVIEDMDMIKLEPGKHTFKIVAVDAQGSKSERIITFSRDVQTLIMMLKEPFATDVQSKKVLVAPGWDVAKGAECRVEVCNNGFDTNPTWEDATAMTELNKAYVFQNNRKTATKWGVNIRLMIERKAAKTNSYITGIGGAFE